MAIYTMPVWVVVNVVLEMVTVARPVSDCQYNSSMANWVFIKIATVIYTVMSRDDTIVVYIVVRDLCQAKNEVVLWILTQTTI